MNLSTEGFRFPKVPYPYLTVLRLEPPPATTALPPRLPHAASPSSPSSSQFLPHYNLPPHLRRLLHTKGFLDVSVTGEPSANSIRLAARSGNGLGLYRDHRYLLNFMSYSGCSSNPTPSGFRKATRVGTIPSCAYSRGTGRTAM
jgi:hypothetical protein